MVNKFSYIGKEVVQSFNDNKGIFDLEDIYKEVIGSNKDGEINGQTELLDN